MQKASALLFLLCLDILLLSLLFGILLIHLPMPATATIAVGLSLAGLVISVLLMVYGRGGMDKGYFVIYIFLLLCWLIVLFLAIHNRFDGQWGGDRESRLEANFEKIRHDEAKLTAFFTAMPKGGDLHNHYSGAIYAESYLERAIADKRWLNIYTLKIDSIKPGRDSALRMDTFYRRKNNSDLKERLFREWSVKDYFAGNEPSDKHFFGTFGKFPPQYGVHGVRDGLKELKKRALYENLQYLELMTGGSTYNSPPGLIKESDELIAKAIADNNEDSLDRVFESVFNNYRNQSAKYVSSYIDFMNQAHDAIDDANFTVRFLTQVKRSSSPAEIFWNLVVAFQLPAKDSLIVGVNFVGPEHDEVPMKNYHLHMKMFGFLHKKFPAVKIALHAGELTVGLVRPEDLGFHINEAIHIAGASRIGHGVDMPFETGSPQLLQYMHDHNIPIEISLTSNQFILKVEGENHPILLYKSYGVPIVLSTDDPGVLRTSLSHEYALLALRYPSLHYSDIRKFNQNGIEFSFITDPVLKARIRDSLDAKLKRFEDSVLQGSGRH